ncbi:MAG: endonuclease/exonuclease/phosphatase family protein [Pseudomonadota bacterium]|nr:endonuclease/exonuclease/phosphatase family protein [Pseudomonadota bacterium]
MVTIALASASIGAPRSRAITQLIWLAALAVAFATTLAEAADSFWVGDMITFFRPQFVLAVLFLLGVALCLRRWLASAALALLLVVNAQPLFAIGVPTAAAANAGNLRILSANLLYNNREPAKFTELVARLSPDVIVTQEARYAWPDLLEALPGYPHLVGREQQRWNTNIVLSRYPMRAALVADMPPSGNELGGGSAVRVEVDLPQRAQPLVVYAIHAPTPRTQAGWKARNRYLDVLAERIAAEPEGTPIALAGDWNTPVWSPAYARTLLLSGLEATERSAWPSPTRLFLSLFDRLNLGTPIDHFAVSRGIGVADFFTGPSFGSDHLPVVADLALP